MAKYPVEPESRLSTSGLWEIQRNYFNHKGVQAWNDEVPFFISSNAFISFRYAHLVMQYLLDNLDAIQDTFYIVEVGAGPGKFSFYFLKAFEKAFKERNLNIKYKYVLTDVAKKNVDFCQQNERFQDLIENGKLDFGIFDVSNEADFDLIKEGVKFSKCAQGNHVVFLCNYVFDVITHDMFQVKDDVLNEVRVSLESRYRTFDREKPENLKEISFNYKTYPVEGESYFDNPILNDILFKYKENYEGQASAVFLMPTGPVEFVENMKKLTDNFLIVCGDLGHATLDELSRVTMKNCHTYEGCFCFLNNFHALGEYFKASGGDVLLTNHRRNYKVCLYSHGKSFRKLGRTAGYYKEELESIGADEFVYMNEEFAYNNYRFSIRACLSFLRMSCYEPDTYYHMHDKVIDLLPHFRADVESDLKYALLEVEDNLYHYQSFYDVFSLLGMFHLKLKQFKKAEYLFKQALKYSKDPFVPLRSLGLMYDERGNSNQAVKFYKKALQYKKNDILCKNRISILEGSPTLVLKPLLKSVAVFAMMIGLLYLVLFK